MSRADDLRARLTSAVQVIVDDVAAMPCVLPKDDGQAIARAICEHLGIGWWMVDGIRMYHRWHRRESGGCQGALDEGADALAELLEAAAIPRDGETT